MSRVASQELQVKSEKSRVTSQECHVSNYLYQDLLIKQALLHETNLL